MLLVILGAGASYDSLLRLTPTKRDVDRPPLANDLFEPREAFLSLMRRFSDLNPIIPYLQAGRPVEQELQDLRRRSGPDSPIHRSLMAVRYYLQKLIAGCERRWRTNCTHGHTNHETLLLEIEEWRRPLSEKVLIVTFNYDRLIEDALLGRAGIKFRDLASCIQNPDYKLFKLHGSVDWARGVQLEPFDEAIAQTTAVAQHIAGAAHLQLTDTYYFHRNVVESIGHLDGAPCVPAIAIPTQQKDGFECPEMHVSLLADLLPEVQRSSSSAGEAQRQIFSRCWPPGCIL